MSAPLMLSSLNVWSQESTLILFGDAVVSSVSSDSRKIKSGDLFVCMPSKNTDTHALIDSALSSGSTAVVVHTKEAFESAKHTCPCVVFAPYSENNEPEFFRLISHICKEIFGDPSQEMSLIGITGTNGKTTVAWLLSQALNLTGRKTAYLGTLGLKISDGELVDIRNTTPFPVDFWNLLNQAKLEGVQDFVFEASSHALVQNRFAGIKLSAAAFTNLSQDHLDFHITMENYAEAKKLLFTDYSKSSEEEPFIAVINEDDPIGKKWLDDLYGQDSDDVIRIGYGKNGRDMVIRDSIIDATGVKFVADVFGESINVRSPLVGFFNALNLETVVGLMAALGSSRQEIEVIIPYLEAVPGRFEAIPNPHGITVIVDYAHTPDALESLLKSAKQITTKRLICVFGCGGDRDNVKRPKMASCSTKIADFTIFTADNPRTESLDRIMEQLIAGAKIGGQFEQIDDRPTAINRAISQAQPGDVVVIAGKGHEAYQIIGKEKFAMDDRQICIKALDAYIPLRGKN